MLIQAKQALQDGDYNTAISLITELVINSTNDSELFAIRAVAYRKIQKFDLSLSDFNKAIELAPENADLQTEKGVTLFHKKSLNEALHAMNIAVKLDPKNPYRYSSRAYIKDALKDIEGAIVDYKKAISLDPEDAIAYNNLGMLEEKQGNLDKAKKHFDRSDNLQGVDMKKITDDAVINGGASVKNEDGKKEVQEAQRQKSSTQEITTPSIWTVILQVFTNREVRKEFIHYLKSLFLKKK